jgi:hypothetical protein
VGQCQRVVDVHREQASYDSCALILKSIVLDGWMDGCKSSFKECILQSKNLVVKESKLMR